MLVVVSPRARVPRAQIFKRPSTTTVFVLFICFAIILEGAPSAERGFLKFAPKSK